MCYLAAHRATRPSLFSPMPSATVDPGLVLKITPPRTRRASAPEAWLARNADRLRDAAIGVVQAAGGFGKTTLLVDLRRRLLAQGCDVGWLLLDARDSGPRLVEGLVASLRVATGDARFGVSASHAARMPGGEIDALTAWLADIALRTRPIALLLDGAQDLPPATAGHVLPYLLHNEPRNLRIVIASRRALPVPMLELRARGDLATLTAKDLRLRLPETIAVLRERLGSDIDADTGAHVQEATEGWPILVQLATSVIEANPGVAKGGLARGSRDLGRYFRESALARLEPHEAEFVVACSHLDALHPDLCRVVTGNPDAAALLDHLHHRTPILTAIEDEGWARMHPLARAAFESRFAALPAEERHALHWRAAQWLREHGDPEAAARHALAAGHDDVAHEWIGMHMYSLALSGNLAEVLAWAERLPPAILALPRVGLAIARAYGMSYQPASTLRQLASLAADRDPDVRFERDLIHAGLSIYADDLETAQALLDTLGDPEPIGHELLHLMQANIAAYLEVESGETERARQRQATARAAVPGSDDIFPTIHGDLTLALSYLREGRPKLSEQAAGPALERLERSNGRRNPATCALVPALAAALWQQDKRDDAESVLAFRIDVVERAGIPESIAIAHAIVARAAFARGDEARALAGLERLHALGEGRHLARLVAASLVEQIRIHASLQRGATCAAIYDRLERCLAGAGRVGARFTTLRGLARARVCLARSDSGGAAAALDEACALAREAKQSREWLEARVLQSLVADADDPRTIASLRESLSLAEANGFVRLFADAHPGLIEVVRAFAAQHPGGCGATTAFVDRVLKSAGRVTDSRSDRRERVGAPAFLTSKEAAILEFLVGGMSNKEIARATGSGQETVKWHLKNLYGKLGAANRRHAVERGRALGFLSSS
jgi:LuxR family transcriptional regulator, maltose regulon positive regulatory protein